MSNPQLIILDDKAQLELLHEFLMRFPGYTNAATKEGIWMLAHCFTGHNYLRTEELRRLRAQQSLRAIYGGVVDNSSVALELRRLLDTCETHFTKLYGYEQVTQGGEAPTGGIEQPQTLDENGPLQATPNESGEAGKTV